MDRAGGRLVHDQPRLPVDGHGANDRGTRDQRIRRRRRHDLPRGPFRDHEADHRTDDGDAPAAVERHGNGLVGDDPTGFLDEPIALGQADPEDSRRADGRQDRGLVTRKAVAVAEPKRRVAGSEWEPRLGGRSEGTVDPAVDACLDRELDLARRWQRLGREQLIGPIAVKVDDGDHIGEVARAGHRPPQRHTISDGEVVEDQAARLADVDLLEVRLARHRDALDPGDVPNQEPHRRLLVDPVDPESDARGWHDFDRIAAKLPALRALPPDLGEDGISGTDDQADHLAPPIAIDVGGHRLQDRRIGEDDHARLVRHRGDRGALRRHGQRRGQEEGQEGGGQEHRSHEHTAALA